MASRYQVLKALAGPPVGLAKEDIPEVEQVIRALRRTVQRFWEPKVRSALLAVEQAVASYEDALGLAVVDVIAEAKREAKELDRQIAVLLALVEDRTACAWPSGMAEAVEEGTRDLLGSGALLLGLTWAERSPLEAKAGARDLLILTRGRLVRQEEKIKALLGQALKDRALRDALRGAQALPSGVTAPEVVLVWRKALSAALGSPWSTWGEAVLDAWAYRWHNVGRFLAGEQAGVQRWIAVNPLDERTTPFCAWVHGRIIALSRTRAQVAGYLDAVNANNFGGMLSAWPLGVPNDQAKFRGVFLDRGLPPYHFRCRTVAVPGR